MEITKATTMGEMLQYDMGIAYVLMEAGMHCVGCPSSIGESLEEACMVHGLNADEVMANIQESEKCSDCCLETENCVKIVYITELT